MTGTLINVASIIVGSLVGLLFRKGIPERINNPILKIQGLVVVIVGLNGLLGVMLTVDADGKIQSSGSLLLLISLTLGCVAGELLRLDDRLNSFGGWAEKTFHSSGFSRGFVTASLIYSVGALSVLGPLNEGISGDASILYIKAALDGITSVVLAASLGAGVLFSALPVFVAQAIPALLARQISPYISDTLLNSFCMAGYSIVICVGLNFLCETKIKVANLLPALVIPVIYHLFILPLQIFTR